jgi:hypothetical protein
VATARPGWSRKAQYGLFFSFLAVVAGIVIGLILLTLSLVAPKTFANVRGAALDITGPVAAALHQVTATTTGLVSGAGNYWDAASQNAELKRERHLMLQRMIEAKAILQENRQLKATLQLRERTEKALHGVSFLFCRLFGFLCSEVHRFMCGRGIRIFHLSSWRSRRVIRRLRCVVHWLKQETTRKSNRHKQYKQVWWVHAARTRLWDSKIVAKVNECKTGSDDMTQL